MPDLEVREPKKRWWMFWKEYMVDAQRRTRNLPYGKRFIIMGGAAVRQPLPLLSKLRDKSDRGGVMVAISSQRSTVAAWFGLTSRRAWSNSMPVALGRWTG